MFKLISATPSPYARKVRIALAEKNLPFELITEVPWNNTTTTPKYNPLEKLPVLILEDGTSVYESSYILQYLELKYPETPLVAKDVDGLLAARLIEVLSDGVCDAVVLTFFEKMRDGGGSPEWIARQRRKIDGGLAKLAELIGDNTFAVGQTFGLGDIALGSLLGYLSVRFQTLDWPSLYPNLARYSEALEKRPSFKSSVPYPQVISDKIV